MQPTPVSNAIETIPTELRDHVSRWFVRLHAEQGDLQLADHEWQRVARLVACSEYAAATLLREWQWFSAALPTLDEIPGEDGLNSEVAAIAQSDDAEAAKKLVRTCRHRWMLQLLWREVGGAASLEETLRSLSLLADRLLDGATRFAHRAVESRFGQVTGDDGEPVSLVILGMGKLGGRELNFSSDIDLVFLYPAGAESNGRKCIGAQDYFTRVSHHILALLDEVTADGFAFRIDTRLRPFGDSGPPVTSFAAFESYLVRHGRDWERYAYVKARIVGQAPPATVADELQRDFIVPFVYRRYLDFGVFESLREMHGLITAEVEKREMADNIKLGPGGIREIEFIVQSLQLVRGGSHPELQDRQLLRVLPRLVGRRGLGERDDEALADAYRFLRRLENFIQAIRDRQTHDLPQDPVDRARLCLAMGYPDWPSLLRDLDGHRERVTRAFESIAFRDQGEEKSGPAKQLAELWETSASRDAWQVHLENHGFADAAAIAERLTAFGAAPATRHIGTVASQRLDMFIPRLLESIKACEEPAVALTRVLALVEKIVRRSAYLALLNENEGVLSRLVTLC